MTGDGDLEIPKVVGDKQNGEGEALFLPDINAVSAVDLVGLYFRQMAQEPLLTADEEFELARRIEAGKAAREALPSSPNLRPRQRAELESTIREAQAAREHLARANTRLVVSVAKRYVGYGLPLADLIQEGNLGLMRAVDRYDYTRGNRFSTYATWWIRQGITRGLAQKTRTIRIPLHMTERIRLLYKTAGRLEQEMGQYPTPEEIAARMELSPECVRSMLEYSRYPIALEQPVGDEGDSEVGDFIEDTDTLEPSDAVDQCLLPEAIETVLAELTPRQGHILRWRFGLGSAQGEQLVLEEIGDKFGLSRERIRQLEKLALATLRHPRLADRLRDYLE